MKFKMHRCGTIVCFFNDIKGFAIKVNINKYIGIMRYWALLEYKLEWIDLD